jgi:hypothetical protein
LHRGRGICIYEAMYLAKLKEGVAAWNK